MLTSAWYVSIEKITIIVRRRIYLQKGIWDETKK